MTLHGERPSDEIKVGRRELRQSIHLVAEGIINSAYGTDDRHALMGKQIADHVVDGTPLPFKPVTSDTNLAEEHARLSQQLRRALSTIGELRRDVDRQQASLVEWREHYVKTVDHYLVVGEAWEKALDRAGLAHQTLDAIREVMAKVRHRIQASPDRVLEFWVREVEEVLEAAPEGTPERRCTSMYQVRQGPRLQCLLSAPHEGHRHFNDMPDDNRRFWTWRDEEAVGWTPTT